MTYLSTNIGSNQWALFLKFINTDKRTYLITIVNNFYKTAPLPFKSF
jgi:hypothetical protein